MLKAHLHAARQAELVMHTSPLCLSLLCCLTRIKELIRYAWVVMLWVRLCFTSLLETGALQAVFGAGGPGEQEDGGAPSSSPPVPGACWSRNSCQAARKSPRAHQQLSAYLSWRDAQKLPGLVCFPRYRLFCPCTRTGALKHSSQTCPQWAP